MNAWVTRRCSGSTESEGTSPPSSSFRRARRANWRHVGAGRPTVWAMASNGTWKTSWRTKTTRSAGLNRCMHDEEGQPNLIVQRDAIEGVAGAGRQEGVALRLEGRVLVPELPAAGCRSDLVETDATGHHRQPAAIVLDAINVGGGKAGERLLHRIFGRVKIAEDPERQVGEVGVVRTPRLRYPLFCVRHRAPSLP